MYTITEVREVISLPNHLNENEHVSNYILKSGKEVDRGASIRKTYNIIRTANRAYTLFKVNGIEVWCLQKERDYWLDILPTVGQDKILAWYEVGSMSPLGEEGVNTVRVSSVDGYQLNFIYNI